MHTIARNRASLYDEVMMNLWHTFMVYLGYRSACCGTPTISDLDMGLTYDQTYCDAARGGCGKRCDTNPKRT